MTIFFLQIFILGLLLEGEVQNAKKQKAVITKITVFHFFVFVYEFCYNVDI